MAKTWLLKTEPSTYSFGDLVRDGRSRWDGVRNATALIHLRAMSTGDRVFIYHSGSEKSIVGMATVVRGPYPDPSAGDPKLVVVDIEPVTALPKPLPLAVIKADSALADFPLVRISRLSVMPVTVAERQRLEALLRA